MTSPPATETGRPPTSLTVSGREFPSVSAAARAHGLSPGLVLKRLLNGWPIDRAFTPARKLKKPVRWTPVVIDGKHFAKRQEVIDHFGVTGCSLKKAQSSAEPLQKALTDALAAQREGKARAETSARIRRELTDIRERGTVRPFAALEESIVVDGQCVFRRS